MLKMIIVLLATLIPLAPFMMYFVGLRNNNQLKATQNLVFAFKGYNVFLALMGLGIIVVWLISPEAAFRRRQPVTLLTLHIRASACS